MGAETRVMWPYAQECQQPLKVGKDKKQIDFPLETSEVSSLSDCEIHFGFMTSSTVRINYVLIYQLFGDLLQQ